jgi:F-type H+-transporting ATPase subunit delta
MSDILSKRYAKALLMLGEEEGQRRELGHELEGFHEELKALGEVGQSLVSPFYPKDQRGRALKAILERSGLSDLAKNFLGLLHDKGRLGLLGQILASYAKLSDEADGLIRGSLTTAAPLTDSQLSAIKGALNSMSGAKVELEVKVDPSIIGGLVARLGDLVVDSSLKTQLDKLSQRLGV